MPRGSSCSSTTTSRIRSCRATCAGREACSSTASGTRPRPTSPPGSRSGSVPTAIRSDRNSGTRRRSPPRWSAPHSCSSSQGARSSASSRRDDAPSASAHPPPPACLPRRGRTCVSGCRPAAACDDGPGAHRHRILRADARRWRLVPARAAHGWAGRLGAAPGPAGARARDSPASTRATCARRCSAELGQPYVTVARAKGLTERRLLIRHVLRAGLLPFVALLSLEMGAVIGASIAVDAVFGSGGLASVFLSALGRADPFELTAILVVSALIVCGFAFLGDWLVALSSTPRVAYLGRQRDERAHRRERRRET